MFPNYDFLVATLGIRYLCLTASSPRRDYCQSNPTSAMLLPDPPSHLKDISLASNVGQGEGNDALAS
jgi:hypothetical protein